MRSLNIGPSYETMKASSLQTGIHRGFSGAHTAFCQSRSSAYPARWPTKDTTQLHPYVQI